MIGYKKHDKMFREACKHRPTLPDEICGWYGNRDELTIRMKDDSILAFDGYHERFYIPSGGGFEGADRRGDKEAVSINLPTMMSNRGVDIDRLSDITRIPENKIALYIEGRHRPGYTHLLKMSNALDCSPSDLTVIKQSISRR